MQHRAQTHAIDNAPRVSTNRSEPAQSERKIKLNKGKERLFSPFPISAPARPFTLNKSTPGKAFPDCACKMLESCSLECQKVAKKLPKIQTFLPKFQKLSPKYLDIFI